MGKNKIPLHDAEGKIVGILATFQDITKRRQAEAIVQYPATHDLLTGLPNRILFNDRCCKILENSRKNISTLEQAGLKKFNSLQNGGADSCCSGILG